MNTIEKHIVMNHLPIPKEIQEYIKEYVFLDRARSEVKRSWELCLDRLNRSIYYENNGHWAFAVYPEVQLQAINCKRCGGFLLTSSILGNNESLCTCV